ncbi:thiol-disulfide oxidoreductase DCC family protein [Mycobacterium kyorinense]|uniref:thiol-disulfide oxidoreductase DCC family protein n=1 Tax=Mycobacterium kyorinense TaxID=487514 RepID=UPI0009ED9E91|nr:DCC1-like thiol-disulfide oxidoreductase family protein [Mycobacterium kyorinense]
MNSTNEKNSAAPVLLYDGVCGFCNRGVQLILRLDRNGTLRFAALDSDYAQRVLRNHPQLVGVDSVVFVDDPGQASERVAVRSQAVFRVVVYLGCPWKVLTVARVVPASLLDWLYDRFADIRYRVFGKYDACPVPSPEVRSRFLDN